MEKKTVFQSLKFTLFSISAGVIQMGSFALLNDAIKLVFWASSIISLVLSVIWNFTFNRRYTFKSANNVSLAMLKVAGYYAVFAPAQFFGTRAFTPIIAGNTLYEYLVQGGFMLINFITEFLFCKFVVYRNSEDTNDIAKREKEKAKSEASANESAADVEALTEENTAENKTDN